MGGSRRLGFGGPWMKNLFCENPREPPVCAASCFHRMAALLLCAACSLGISAPARFDLNLSAPARMRWHGALAATLAKHPFESSWLPTFAEHNTSLFDHLEPEHWTALVNAFEKFFPEHAEELRGIHDDFTALLPAAGVTYEYLVGWVYFHELAHTPLAQASSGASRECTALLARAPSSPAGVLHVANMDQSPTAVRNLTLDVTFHHADGSVSHRGVDWYWFTTGVSRTVKAGLASLQENWRSGTRPTEAVMADITAGATPQILVFRGAFASYGAGEYAKLEAWLETVALAAPYYVIAASPAGEGVVFARSARGVDGKQWLGGGNATAPSHEASREGARNGARYGARDGAAPASAGGDDWFLVQTNYDHWLADPPSDPRRTFAEGMLSEPLALLSFRVSPHTPHSQPPTRGGPSPKLLAEHLPLSFTGVPRRLLPCLLIHRHAGRPRRGERRVAAQPAGRRELVPRAQPAHCVHGCHGPGEWRPRRLRARGIVPRRCAARKSRLAVLQRHELRCRATAGCRQVACVRAVRCCVSCLLCCSCLLRLCVGPWDNEGKSRSPLRSGAARDSNHSASRGGSGKCEVFVPCALPAGPLSAPLGQAQQSPVEPRASPLGPLRVQPAGHLATRALDVVGRWWAAPRAARIRPVEHHQRAADEPCMWRSHVDWTTDRGGPRSA